MFLTRFSLRNRALIALVTVFIMIGGLIALGGMRRELIPPLQIPIAGVVTVVPGAGPGVIEDQVTSPIEAAVLGVEGVEKVESTSSASLSSVTVDLKYGTDLPQAQAKIQRAVLAVRNLPEGADPRVITGSIDDFPVMQIAASGGENADQLAERVKNLVVPELEDVPGVREVQVSGAADKIVRIDLDEDEMKRLGITASSVTSLLQANGVVVPGGRLTEGGQDLSVQTGSRLTSVEEIRDLPLAALPKSAANPLAQLSAGSGGGGAAPRAGTGTKPRTGAGGAGGTGGMGGPPAMGGMGMLAPVPHARVMAPTPPTPTSPTGTPTGTPSPTGTATSTPPSPTSTSASPSPTTRPTGSPTGRPTTRPTDHPTGRPTGLPTTLPTALPTTLPTAFPTTLPPGTPWPEGLPPLPELVKQFEQLPKLIAALQQLEQLQGQLQGLEQLQKQLKGLEQLQGLQGQLGELRKLQGQLEQLRGLQGQLGQLAQLQGQLQQLQGLQGQLAGLSQLQGQLKQLQGLQAQLAGLSELQKQLSALQGNQTVPTPKIHTLGDVAEVALVNAPGAGVSRSDGRPSVTLAITKTPEAGAVDVSHAVQDKLTDAQSKIPGGKLAVVFDQAPFIEQSIDDLGTEGALGLVMAVLVVFAFLLSLPLTLVTALSIPMSLLVAIIGMKTGGLSLNILTLGALTISVGRVVDDSIVVIENIKRHLDLGEPKNVAIPAAVKEVAAAITASTASTVAVFLPIGVVGGQAGELFRPFALTVALAMSASLLVALTIIPVLGYWFVRGSSESSSESSGRTRWPRSRRAPRTHDTDSAGLVQRAYMPALGLALRRPVATLLVAFLLLGATGLAATGLKTDFIGDSGSNSLQITQSLPAGTTLEKTDDRAKALERLVRARPEVASVQTTITGSGGSGLEALFSGGGSNTARTTVTLDEGSDAKAVSEALRAEARKHADLGTVSVSESGGGGPGSRQVEVSVQAADDTDLRAAADTVEKAVRGVGGTRDIANNLAADVPQLSIDVDRAEALKRGLTEPQIGLAVSNALQGATIGKVEIDQQRHDVVVHERPAPETIAALEDIPVGSDLNGKTVRLHTVADVDRTKTAASISRVDGRRTALITAVPEGDDLGGLTRNIQSALDATQLPAGASATIGGVSADQQEAFGQLGIALLVAIAIVYVVMVATFGSLIQPLILLVSVPLAATGALAALELTGTALGVPAIIGLLMLVGIVVTNAIVLIDLVNQHRAAGAGVEEAVVEGARDRVRPIVMTALATILALVPMAMSLSGGGAFISQPLALVVIGGLFSSTALTLLVVPALYLLVERRRAGRGNPRDPFAETPPRTTEADAPVSSGATVASGVSAAPQGSEGSGTFGSTARRAEGTPPASRTAEGDVARSENGPRDESPADPAGPTARPTVRDDDAEPPQT
ncbi:efflux RND transporter permease subunit [Mobilicoccus pelagius]|uniref:Putative drug resistance transporter n=1 Tax=Mobilicoccus pelagius NBRC 104925 TaxID=1089455 RepID=H5UVS6_9MICO|nr:efflux RND transporter permease subunit [Mobilicoccus pelagius]GAB49834.1 putative drug resistance transporter [Mobilicoccus pelagius NBRC 104925]